MNWTVESEMETGTKHGEQMYMSEIERGEINMFRISLQRSVRKNAKKR
jgi:hypothetical protein